MRGKSGGGIKRFISRHLNCIQIRFQRAGCGEGWATPPKETCMTGRQGPQEKQKEMSGTLKDTQPSRETVDHEDQPDQPLFLQCGDDRPASSLYQPDEPVR